MGEWQKGDQLNGTARSLAACHLVCHGNVRVSVTCLSCPALRKNLVPHAYCVPKYVRAVSWRSFK